VNRAQLPAAEFGFLGELRDRLVAAILEGEKTSTTGLYAEYEEEGSIDDETLVVAQRFRVVERLDPPLKT